MSDNENPAFVEEPSDYASLRRGKRIDLAQAVPLPAPLAVYVEPTNICNFRCVFCPESFMEYEDIAGGLFKLAPDDFERIASQIIAIGGVQTLNFYMMGEPFANRNLFDYIRIAKERSLGRKLIPATAHCSRRTTTPACARAASITCGSRSTDPTRTPTERTPAAQ